MNLQNNPEPEITDALSAPATKGSKHSKPNKTLKICLIVLAVILSICIVAAVSFTVMYNIGKNQLVNRGDVDLNTSDLDVDEDGDIIEYNGEKYKFNKNVTTVLFMGVDTDNIKKTHKTYGTSGQADTIFLMAMDTSSGKADVISLSRESMAEIGVYSKSGAYIGTDKRQLCLAYAFGDGRHKSCENMAESVSRLMFGMPVDNYFAMDLNAIKPLTKAVGGVTVNVYDKSGNITGTKKITPDMAEPFVRDRDTSYLTSNNERMGNQMEFLQGFINAATVKVKKDISVPVKFYDIVANYSVSGLTVSKITFLTSKFLAGGCVVNYHTVPGTTTEGKFAEYNIDNDACFKIILDVFYNKL